MPGISNGDFVSFLKIIEKLSPPPRLLARLLPVDVLFPALLAGQFLGFHGFHRLGQVREETAGEFVAFFEFDRCLGLYHSRLLGQGRAREASHGNASGQEKGFTGLENEGSLLNGDVDVDGQQRRGPVYPFADPFGHVFVSGEDHVLAAHGKNALVENHRKGFGPHTGIEQLGQNFR